MIEFTLWGVPVRIQPWHWAGLAFIGGILWIREPAELIPVGIFMIAGFLAILIHEMGHALVGRKYGGGGAAVTLIVLGGYTEYFNSRFSKKGRSLTILAGPGSTLVLGLLAWLAMIIYTGNIHQGTAFTWLSIRAPQWPIYSSAAFLLTQQQQFSLYLIGSFVWISFWWTLLNLLPIIPLDGGQFLAQHMRSPRRLHLVGLGTCALILIYALTTQNTFMMVFMAYLAFMNYKAMQNSPF